MGSIKLNVPGDPGSIRKLMALLSIKGCDGNVIYELHDQRNPEKKEPEKEFCKRSEPYYKAFISSYMVDQWASDNISYAAKIDGVWYFAINTGSNTYIGSGPMSTLRLRKFCSENGIKILYIEQDFEEWYARTLGNGNIILKETRVTVPRTVSQSYNEVNHIISACGEGIARMPGTASKLKEEDYRNLFLSAFCTHQEKFTVEGESINKKGYTDLKIFDTALRVPYIYEFKVYNSKSNLREALLQVTETYATVNNRYNGVVLLNKRNIDLSKLMEEIRAFLDSSFTASEIEVLDLEHKIIVRHCHTADSKIKCILTIFVFDIRND